MIHVLLWRSDAVNTGGVEERSDGQPEQLVHNLPFLVLVNPKGLYVGVCKYRDDCRCFSAVAN